MTTQEILKQLEEFGNEGTKKVLMKHGAKEPFFGVKVQDLKKIVKKVKKNYELSKELYATGNSDAMYLAALIADEKQMTKEDVQVWVKSAYWSYLSEYAVPWVASETKYGMELGLEWIESKEETIASAGWTLLGCRTAVVPDEEIDNTKYKELLERAEKNVHNTNDRRAYTMNGFVIAVGSSVPELTEYAKEIGARIGEVKVHMNGTACKVPLIKEYIEKVESKGRIGNKKKTARC